MESPSVISFKWLLSLCLSLFLLMSVFTSTKVMADTAPVKPTLQNNVQLAWWHRGYYHHRGWGYYHRGWGHRCARHCWRNRWGYRVCRRRCW